MMKRPVVIGVSKDGSELVVVEKLSFKYALYRLGVFFRFVVRSVAKAMAHK